MCKDLAPIVLFVYNRPEHTQLVINALRNNDLSRESVLYIYCDGPKQNSGEKELSKVLKTREVVKNIQGFKKIKCIYADNNIGCRNSILRGISEVIDEHGKMIFLEDDTITSKKFLSFLNVCLSFYENRKSVFSISANCPPCDEVKIPNDYAYDVYAFHRQFNWGMATWKDRWFQINWDKSFIPEFIQNKSIVEAFSRGGDDLIGMLIDEYNGQSDTWDIQFTYNHFRNHAISIVPCKPYVKNIGLDGSGTHCGKRNYVVGELMDAAENIRLLDVLYIDRRIANQVYSYYCRKKLSTWKKAVNRTSRMLGGENVFTIKKKVYD